MSIKADLPRQQSKFADGENTSREWYNFFRRLRDDVDAINASSGGGTTIINNGMGVEKTLQDPSTARTLTDDDANTIIEFTNSSAVTVSLNSSLPIRDDAVIYLLQGGVGQVTVVAGSGVTIDYSDSLKTRTQESMIGLKQIQPNKWELFGDAEPVAPARSALIRSANSVGAPAWVAPTADSQKLKQVSGALAWATDTASEIVNVPAGNIAATNVQTALNELDTEKAPLVHTHVSTDITDFNSASRAQTEAELVAGANITITPASSGATRTLTIASSGGGATDITTGYNASYVFVYSSTGADTTIDGATTSAAGVMSASDKTKLDGIATGATANSSDAYLLDRVNHTGTVTASIVSDFSTAVDTRIGLAGINALSDVVITAPSATQVLKYNGTNWINDTDATGGGGSGISLAVAMSVSSMRV